MTSTAPAIEFRGFGLTFSGSDRERRIVHGVGLEVLRGEFLLLIGESGSGKSTVLKLLAGLWDEREPLPTMVGDVRVLGESVARGRYPRQLRGRVQAVLQDEGLLDELSPRGNVELALRKAARPKSLSLALLSQAGLDDPPDSVAELSGGMRKRLAVARALAGEPELLIFDEPTAGLDADSARGIAELLAGTRESPRAAAKQTTTIVITHDVRAFEGLVDRVLWLDHKTQTLVGLDASTALERIRTENERADLDSDEPMTDGDSPSIEEEFGLHGARRFLLGLAAGTSTFYHAAAHILPVYPAVVVRTIGRFVVEPTFFVVIGSATVGGLATFFALRNNPLEGAFAASVITGAGKVLIAVLIPLLTGFFFTARIAAGAAARVGTMKRTNQVAALRVMGISPADYLLTPMVWACSIAMPVATLCGLVMTAVFSCGAAVLVSGISPFGWGKAFFAEIDAADLRYVLLKTVLSGFLVAVITFHLAIGPKHSGRAVGQSVNSSIVFGIYAVLLVHALLTLIQFA